MEKIKIVYLTGFWYSGATILGRILRSSAQAIYVGEIRDYWIKGIKRNGRCSCGERFNDCNFWKKVTKEYFDSFPSLNIEKVTRDLLELEKTKSYPRLRKFIKHKDDEHFQNLLNNYLNHTEKLYAAIAKVSGKNIIIDSSRLPGRLLALSVSNKLDIYPVYMIRDPRGVINSLIKKYNRNYGGKKPGLIRHILTWNAKNLLSLNSIKISKLNSTRYVWYDYFTSYPLETLDKLKAILNCTFNYEKVNGKILFDLTAGHVFTGNRSRKESGKITIYNDTKWQQELSAYKKALISVTSLPLLKFIVKKYHLKQD